MKKATTLSINSQPFTNHKTRRFAAFLALLLLLLPPARNAWGQTYNYGFEDNNLQGNGWWIDWNHNPENANTGELGITSDVKKSGNYGFRFSSYNYDANPPVQYLVVKVPDATNRVLLQFYYRVHNSNSPETFWVGYLSNNAWSWADQSHQDITNTSWALYRTTFPATEYVIIAYMSQNRFYLYLDDFSFTTPSTCNLSIELTDAYGDGGGNIQVLNSITNEVLFNETLGSGSSQAYTLSVYDGTPLSFVYTSTDNWPYENGYVITDPNGDIIASHTGCSSSGDCSAPTNGVVATYTVNCPPPPHTRLWPATPILTTTK